MPTYALPVTLAPTRLEWGLRSNTWQFQSPLSGSVQTLEMPGARWTATFGYQDMSAEKSPEYESFLIKMRGMANRFTAYNFFRPVPRGTMRGTLTVAIGTIAAGASTGYITGGAGQAAKSLIAGDFLTINAEYKMITVTNNSDGSGNIFITFEPPMRAAANVGASVVWDKPLARFVMMDPEVQWQYETTALRNLQFSGMEAW